jgi:hypothetical protein
MMPMQNIFASRFGAPKPFVGMLPARPMQPGSSTPQLPMPMTQGGPNLPPPMGINRFAPMAAKPQFGAMQPAQPRPMAPSAPQNAIAQRLGMAF